MSATHLSGGGWFSSNLCRVRGLGTGGACVLLESDMLGKITTAKETGHSD